jgi:cysteine desulfurase
VDDVKKAVRGNTSVVAVMHINNETGSVNDIVGIQKFCRRRGIKYLADTVQSFGKYKLPDLDACTVSFHKLYGPPGVGCLIVDRGILCGRGFTAQISGSQNGGYRGGTENLPGIAGALKTMELTFRQRPDKNKRLKRMKGTILANIGREFDEEDFRDYIGKSDHFRGFNRDWSFTQIGGYGPEGRGEGAPNTLLLSFNKSKSDPHHFCNVMLKKELAKHGVVVSIGSACHTKSKGPSHVLKAMKAPFIVRCGVVRISLGDYNTLEECDRFSKILVDCIRKQE